jgi:hypothetical protein
LIGRRTGRRFRKGLIPSRVLSWSLLRIGGMRPRRSVVAGPLINLEQQGEFNVGGADCGVGVGKFNVTG